MDAKTTSPTLIGNTALYFFAILAMVLTACSQANPPDLSFAGITMGKEFPDSLKTTGHFEYYDNNVPFYEGSVIFDLPNFPKKELHVVATTDLQNKEVTCIQLTMFMPEASDFYNMLKSKYGLPSSDFGDTDCSLQTLINRVYEQLGYKSYAYFGECPNISGTRVLAVWEPASYKSAILLITDTYHSQSSYNSQLDTFVRFKYINVKKSEAVEKEVQKIHDNKQRDDYRKDNAESMSQDF